MKVFVAVCIFSVMLAVSTATQAELGLKEYNLLDPSKTEADLEEGTGNLARAANENFQEDDVTEEERIGGRCVCKRPPCPCDRRPGRSEEEQRRKKCRNGFTWPHCN